MTLVDALTRSCAVAFFAQRGSFCRIHAEPLGRVDQSRVERALRRAIAALLQAGRILA
jgi:hypothetical protein